MFRTEISFFFVVIANITVLLFIIKRFFWIDKFNGKKSAWSIVAKVFSVILNLVLCYGVFWAIVFGLFLISPYGFLYKSDTIYMSDFCTGFALLETAVFLLYGLNFLLYKIWYRKVDISKWWIFSAIIIGVGVLAIVVLNVVSGDYIKDWSTIEWIRR
ncbi:MAG: hypothetical protein NC177_01955 [Ruminococcus flavefaciens]|nr:hypothetical protein [Ruminococcus flavefaciens]